EGSDPDCQSVLARPGTREIGRFHLRRTAVEADIRRTEAGRAFSRHSLRSLASYPDRNCALSAPAQTFTREGTSARLIRACLAIARNCVGDGALIRGANLLRPIERWHHI